MEVAKFDDSKIIKCFFYIYWQINNKYKYFNNVLIFLRFPPYNSSSTKVLCNALIYLYN